MATGMRTFFKPLVNNVMKMRMLISGSNKNANTIGAFISRHLDSSIDFEILTFHDRFSAMVQSPGYRLLYRLWPRFVVSRMDAEFVRQVMVFKPEVVVVFKGMEISKNSLNQIRKLGVKLVNYNFDHPFNHFSRGTGNRFVTEAIPYYDLHISYSTSIASQLNERYKLPTAVIPFGYHLTNSQFEEVMNADDAEILEICFVGNPDEWRLKLLNKLRAEKLRVHVYGFGWEQQLPPSEYVVIHPPKAPGSYWSDPLEFWRVLRQYRVQLNFFRPHNEGSHNLRTFEVPAVGGILLTPDSVEQKQFFESEKEVFFYSDFESLAKQSRKILAMTPHEIKQVRNQARQRSVVENYSYKRRTHDMLKLIRNIVTNQSENS
jgi:spore maturation protein CgeB